MGRDAKPFLNSEAPRSVFPLPRRTSLTGSFSLPTLSLSSRTKAAPPSLPPLDISSAHRHPCGDDSTVSSRITASSSQPFPSSSTEPHPHPSSPLKPPASPGPSVPLPSIRSLRSRFSFSSGSQDQSTTPSRAAQTPQKRVVSRRFLPFGSSNAGTSTANTNPNLPRKSLGDMFALGRSSTSSRLDAASTRSGTPSGRSSRSVTSAATLRGWGSTSKHLEPGTHARLSFNRPRSHDYTLDSDLGFVVAIGGPDETIRQRPSTSAHTTPVAPGATSPVEESSQEEIHPSVLCDTPGGLSRRDSVKMVSSLPPSAADAAAGSGSILSTQPSVSHPPPPVKRPPPLDLKSSAELGTELIRTPVTIPESHEGWENSSSAAYPFAPVDDRSDITSSTHNTPSSVRKSAGGTQVVMSSLPSPSPFRSSPSGIDITREAGEDSDAPHLAALQSAGARHDTALLRTQTSLDSTTLDVPTRFPSSRSARREHAIMGLLGELDNTLTTNHPAQQTAQVPAGAVPDEKATAGTGHFSDNRLLVEPSELPAGRASRAPSDPEAASESLNLETPVGLEMHPAEFGQPQLNGNDSTFVREDQRTNLLFGDETSLTARVDLNCYPANLVAYRSSRDENGRDDPHLQSLGSDLTKLLSPNRLSHISHSAPNSALVPTIALPPSSPSYPPEPLQSGSRTPQAQHSLDLGLGSGSLHLVPTPSPSSASFRPNDIQIPLKHSRVSSPSVPHSRGYQSARNSPILPRADAVSISPAGFDRGDVRDFSSPLSGQRVAAQRSPSVGAAMTRKRSASFDLTGSTTFTKDGGDPFTSHSNGPRRPDWLGPRTAKAFAAAGLLDGTRDKERLYPISSVRSDGQRGASWRNPQNELPGRLGNARSHSRLGSEIISPSSRSRALTGGADSSPSYRRGSLDHTAPPSPVSTHRTLVSSVTSSSQSQQSVLQSLRERHELETEALLLALAGSKKSERDLRIENEQLLVYIKELELRIATLENDRDQERVNWRNRDHSWNTTPTADIDVFDRRRQDILAGRASTRVWGIHNRMKSLSSNRTPAHPASRALLSSNETPRAASVAGAFRSNNFGIKPRSATPPTKRSDWVDPVPTPRTNSASPRMPTSSAISRPPATTLDTSVEFEKWHEESFISHSEPHVRSLSSRQFPNNSVTSLEPQLPGSMSLLMQEAVPLSEDEYSFRSASPSSLTLVQPRNSTPKPHPPANISPITAEFSFNSIPGSPRSLRLRPDEEMHLADLISLQGLEITDVLGDAE